MIVAIETSVPTQTQFHQCTDITVEALGDNRAAFVMNGQPVATLDNVTNVKIWADNGVELDHMITTHFV